MFDVLLINLTRGLLSTNLSCIFSLNICGLKIYPKDGLQRFEFERIKNEILKYCHSEPGRKRTLELLPSDDVNSVQLWLDQTREMHQIVANGLSFPDIGFPPLSQELKWLKIKGSRLEGSSFLRIAVTATTIGTVYRFLHLQRHIFPSLFEIVSQMENPKTILALIKHAIDDNGGVKSSASQELADIRKQLSRDRVMAKKRFEQVIRKYKHRGWLRDFDESHYNNRRVLAVESEHKRKIKGIIHGISESRKSAFIEPMEVVEINNQVATLEQEEQIVVNRILTELTAQIAVYLPDILAYNRMLGDLDFTRGKVRMALTYDGQIPVLSKTGSIRLIKASHPLLYWINKAEEKPTIPLDLWLTKEERMLVISGPNAGGKSIALKTLGLLQIMYQSGLMIPVAEGSEMMIFDHLFVDIGDDQSVDYELSTYSARLQKMKYFLRAADPHTLVLIDEFGTGSDPDLGGALAEVMLGKLLTLSPYGMITTHYNNIKVFAEQHRGVSNGAMLFEQKTLKPLYVLATGQPGSSFTFEVAEKMGLHPDLIKQAKASVSEQKVKFDRVLVQLQARKNELNRKNRQLSTRQKNVSNQLAKLKEEYADLHQKLQDVDDVANKKLMAKGRKYEQLLLHWKKNKQKKELIKKIIIAVEKEEVLISKRKKEVRTKKSTKKPKDYQTNEKPRVGDLVKIGRGKQGGDLIAIDEKRKKATIHFGMIKTIVDLDQVVVIKGRDKKSDDKSKK